jgi:hypothetical protein
MSVHRTSLPRLSPSVPTPCIFATQTREAGKGLISENTICIARYVDLCTDRASLRLCLLLPPGRRLNLSDLWVLAAWGHVPESFCKVLISLMIRQQR